MRSSSPKLAELYDFVNLSVLEHQDKNLSQSWNDKSIRRSSRRPLNSGPTNVQCHMCFKIFSSQASLRTHLYFQHRSHRYFPCPVCGKTYLQAFTMIRLSSSNFHQPMVVMTVGEVLCVEFVNGLFLPSSIYDVIWWSMVRTNVCFSHAEAELHDLIR
ncbi:uncharacterized protein LOC111086971 [Limulus polyphemus]|uniref:Uncharacterized protein LOC111086971 n=1 Tax=Limulus polyphemus TaxID=6850 RepID=A0ABM1SVK1_LIMPO|nr:uncharacterized protein LOC111086971 [Limulus polyphemus]